MIISTIQFITQPNESGDHIPAVQLACEAGIQWVQLRIKAGNAAFRKQQAKTAQGICRKFGAKLIINDNVLLANEIDAHGVHIGLEDMDIEEARAILGSHKIIGATANTIEHLEHASTKGADYMGLGPFRFTKTKNKLSPILGLEGYRKLMTLAGSLGIRQPIVAIGGIRIEDLRGLVATGVTGVAVSSLIQYASDPKAVVGEMRKYIP